MNNLFKDNFGARFHADLVSAPESAKTQVCFPGAIQGGWVEGLGVEFFPEDGPPWYGSFARGDLSRNAVNFAGSCPDKTSALIVAKGEGYIVSSSDPKQWSELPLRPVMGVIADAGEELIVVWDFVRMVCIDCHGVRWKTHSISWDGIKDVFIRNGEVHANIWDAPNSCFNAARVNLDNGSVIGGSCPPLIEHHPMT